MKIGTLLKNLRKGNYLTLREVETATNISNAYLSQLENNKIKSPSIWTVYTLSNLYGINLNDFMALAEFEKL